MPQILTRLIMICAIALVCTQVASAADAAYERDLIDRVQVAFAGPQLPPGTHICPSPLLLEIRLTWGTLSEPTKASISQYVAFERPVLVEEEIYDTPDGHFRIHFTRIDTNAVNMSFGVGPGNVPIYILNCADILEHVRAKETDTLGFRFPVSDQVPRPAEDPHFDVYCQSLSRDFYGLSYPDTVINNGTGNAWWATSYMVLQSDYTKIFGYEDRPFDAMAVTVAHEFHHSCQWTYDAYEAEFRVSGGQVKSFSWWLEVSAVAMEEIVYDGINDYYGYLPTFFNNPGVSLRAFATTGTVDGLHPYGSAIWALFLTQKFHDESVLREIWEECGEVDGFNTFAAFDSVLIRRGTTLSSAWAEFLVWNYFTGSHAASWDYEEGAAYPMLRLPDSVFYDEFPVSDTSNLAGYPNPADEYGAAYMRFDGIASDTATTFRIVVSPYDPDNYENWMVVTAGISGGLKPEIKTWDVFSTIEVANWDTYDEILVIATPFVAQPTQDALLRRLGFSFVVADSLSSGGTITAIRKIYSNPLTIASGTPATFQVDVSRAEAIPVTMQIFTIDGREVRGGENDNDAENLMYAPPGRTAASMRWNGTTSAGDPVATGIYLALLRIGDHSELVKVAVKNQMR